MKEPRPYQKRAIDIVRRIEWMPGFGKTVPFKVTSGDPTREDIREKVRDQLSVDPKCYD